jgi:hypothetical protein
MNVYILGIDHWIQHRDGLGANSHAEFEKLLREIIREYDITFIGDETFPERKAIAKEVANPPDIVWEPIEMPEAMRDELGIADQLKNRPFETAISDEGTVSRKHGRVPSDAIRENYMVNCAITKAGAAKSILILCGFQHGPELQARFANLGHQVTLDSLCKRSWYKNSDCE